MMVRSQFRRGIKERALRNYSPISIEGDIMGWKLVSVLNKMGFRLYETFQGHPSSMGFFGEKNILSSAWTGDFK